MQVMWPCYASGMETDEELIENRRVNFKNLNN